MKLVSSTVPSAEVTAAAERLILAARTGVPCPPVRDLIGSGDLAAAYAVQRQVVESRILDGARVVGRKIGLTSPAVQAQLGVDRPDFGVLLDDMDVSDLDEVPLSGLLQPKIEAEIAFVLAHDLDTPGEFDRDTVTAAVALVAPALEIVDSRIAEWDITFGDTVADNGSSGLFVLGHDRVPLRDCHPVEAEMTMLRAGAVVSTGSGAACLGDPLNALAWLAETAYAAGDPLRAGEVILSGALGPMVQVHPGDRFEAHITGVGTVVASFAGGAA